MRIMFFDVTLGECLFPKLLEFKIIERHKNYCKKSMLLQALNAITKGYILKCPKCLHKENCVPVCVYVYCQE